MKQNKLLTKQLLKYLPSVAAEPGDLAEFLEAINMSYDAYDRDIELLNHAFRLSEDEYLDINMKLQEEINVKKISIGRLKNSVRAVSGLSASVKQEQSDDELLDIVNYLDSQIEKRKQAEQVYTSLIKNLQSGILLEDEKMNIVFTNQLFCDMFSIPMSSEELPGTDWNQTAEHAKQFFKDEEGFLQRTACILEKKEIVSGEILVLKDGRTFQREYIPLFNNSEYKGHLWKYADITEKIASEEKLQNSEARFRLTLKKLGDNVWEHDFLTGESYFSNTDYGLLGYNGEETLDYAALWWNSIYPEDLHKLRESDENYKNGRTDHHSLEYRILHKDGLIKWVLDKGVVTDKTPEGLPLKIIGTHTDITAIKEIQNALKESEQQFKSLSENIPGIIFSYSFEKNGSHGFRYLSPAIEKILGITASEFSNPEKFVHPEDLLSLFSTINAASNSKRPFTFEGRLIIPGKGTFWISAVSSFSFVRGDGARIYTGLITNITQRKMIEEAQRIREEKYRNIAANMRLGLLEVDNNNIVTLANQSFCEMSGYTLSELMGKDAGIFLQQTVQSHSPDTGQNRPKTGQSEAYEISLCNKNGEAKWWLVSTAPHYNDVGVLIGSINIHLDITNQKKLERDLIQAKLYAEKSAQAKELFLANMSHEIRTPMNAIMGMGQQLLKTGLDSRQSMYVSAINNSSEHLLVIINDILDISKIEAGKMNIEHIGFEFSAVIKSAVEVMVLKAEEKGLELGVVIDPSISKILIGDPYRLKQIILNHISNSIKFTERGSVMVHCRIANKSELAETISVTITDTGVGMDEDFLKDVFTKFSQEDNSIARKYGGTGLGMSISKKLLELMDGTIEVTSTKKIGTAITFTIPFLTGGENDIVIKEDNVVDTSILAGSRILVVEDNEMNRLVANTVLEQYDVLITEAENGMEALTMLGAQQFDLILMDVQMPVMNGIEATMRIRKEISTNIPIIALTANAIKGENEKCIAAGMNAYVTKPFEEESLIKTIGALLGKEIKIKATGKTSPALNDKLFDLDGLRKLSRGNEAFVRKMINIFIKSAPESVTEMKEAVEANDIGRIKSVAHRLKPSIDSLCISSMKTRIREIESFTGDHCSNGLKDLVEETDEIISTIVIEFRKQFAV
jgi:two-component system, sensor histidine kinase